MTRGEYTLHDWRRAHSTGVEASTLYRTLGEHTLQDSRRAHSTELEASTLYMTRIMHTLHDSRRAHSTGIEASTLYRTPGEHTLHDSRRAHSTGLEASILYRTRVTPSDYPFDIIKLFLLAIALSFFELRLQITPLIVLNFFTLYFNRYTIFFNNCQFSGKQLFTTTNGRLLVFMHTDEGNASSLMHIIFFKRCFLYFEH